MLATNASLEAFATHALLGGSLAAVGIVHRGAFVYASDGLRRSMGWSADAGSVALEVALVPSDRKRVEAAIAAVTDVRRVVECRMLRAGGTEFDAELAMVRAVGLPAAAVVLCTDVTAHRRATQELSYLAFIDPLTGLGNRALFADRLRDTLMEARRTGRSFAVLFADLDDFKAVNDTYGHDVGDALLREVAGRLRAITRDSDTVARLGGDDFAFVLPQSGTPQVAALVAGRIVLAVSEPMRVRDLPVRVGISVGVAVYPDHGRDQDALVAAADSGVYASKRGGRNRYTFPEHAEGHGVVHAEFIAWDDTRNLGVDLIDTQHARLAALINDLGEDLKFGRDRDRLLRSLTTLVDYTEKHFWSEETLMRTNDLPGLESHARAHTQLLEDVRCMSIGLDEKSMMLTMRYLYEWLVRHVETYDRALVAALSAAVKPA